MRDTEDEDLKYTQTSLINLPFFILCLYPSEVRGRIYAEWKNRYTNITPALLHFNADGKTRIRDVYKSITNESDEYWHTSMLASRNYGCGAGFVKNFVYDSSSH